MITRASEGEIAKRLELVGMRGDDGRLLALPAPVAGVDVAPPDGFDAVVMVRLLVDALRSDSLRLCPHIVGEPQRMLWALGSPTLHCEHCFTDATLSDEGCSRCGDELSDRRVATRSGPVWIHARLCGRPWCCGRSGRVKPSKVRSHSSSLTSILVARLLIAETAR